MQAQSILLPGDGAEEWRPVVGYEGWYSVSSLGRVRRDRRGPGTRPNPLKKLGRPCTAGYFQVYLSHGPGSKPIMAYVHALVAEAFLGERPAGYEINHIDGVKLNNRLENLEYVTPQGNHDHAKRLGLKPYGERHGNAKLTEAVVLAIRASDEPQAVLAQRHDVHIGTIRGIQNGEAWPHVGGRRAALAPSGRRLRRPTLPVETIRAIRASTESSLKLARLYGTSHETVRAIRLGLRWAHII